MKTETKKTILLLLGGCVAGMLVLAISFGAVHATSSDKFCANCHSNHSLAAERGKSIHGNNRAGMVVKCVDCHIAQGTSHVLSKKIASIADVFTFVATDDFNSQKWLDEHRQEEAGAALEYISSFDSGTCKSCHEMIEKDLPKAMNPLALKVHEYNNAKLAGEQKQCIFCHRGVAHEYNKDWFVEQTKHIL